MVKNKINEFIESPKFSIVVIVTGVLWMNTQIYTMKTNLERHFADRVSGAMYIALQDELQVKNPAVKWLNSKEIRSIQSEHPPYNKHND